ncbi:hypothetical protein J437_LFUL018301 [Ladona fulva]|uniref:Uncharacterized protein n=1 Tax=Ladona fulva TaxID=123851 RepID=A0A8K0KNZ2_LADFU|nr:hypothetical protein J437_LFUL018301 [Ladona fulva]
MEDLTRMMIELLNPQCQQNAEQPIPTFMPFDPLSELWKDYWARFQTFANSMPPDQLPQIFLTNQTTATYKLFSTLAAQQSPPKDINELSMNDIASFMDQFDPRRFTVRERFKFWSEMQDRRIDSRISSKNLSRCSQVQFLINLGSARQDHADKIYMLGQ